MDRIREKLFSLKDNTYGDFTAKLIPTIQRETVIGCRTPELKKLAKTLSNDLSAVEFLDRLPHRYYEENNLHGFLIAALCKEIGDTLNRVEAFLPYIDNWATCDGTVCALKLFAKHPQKVAERMDVWLSSGNTYTVRFAVVTLMNYFLEKNFDEKYFDKLRKLPSGDYYIDMAVAWYFCTALTKRYAETIHLFEDKVLPHWTHNKAIQKACESFRISEERKTYLRTLKYPKEKR